MKKELEQEEPMFQSHIIKIDLVQMIIDALRFRVKWPEIEKGVFFNSPALKRIAKLWYERVGLRYINLEMEANNHKIVQAKIRKAEKKQGRVRRNALKPGGDFPQDKLAKFIRTHKLDSTGKNSKVASPSVASPRLNSPP